MAQLLSQKIKTVAEDNEESFLRNIYRPIELKLTEKGMLVVKNSFQIGDDVVENQFDLRKEYELQGKNIFAEKMKSNERWQLSKDKDNLNRTRNFQTQNFQNPQNTQNIQNGQQKNRLDEHYHLGLLNSLLYNSNQKYFQKWNEENKADLLNPNEVFEGKEKIKVMICITAYSEKQQELEKSISGITNSLDSFLKQGYLPHQIGVIVIFDGIANICNNIDENDKSYHDNIIPYFQSKLDKRFGITKEKTLGYQYNNYILQTKRANDYKPDNIAYLRAHRDEFTKKYRSHRNELKKTMKRLLKENNPQFIWTDKDEYIEQNIVNAMEDQYKRAKKFLENRKNTAWVYQDRFFHSDSGGFMPIFYVFKFSNGSKLSSHMWFFQGFCKELNPDYCVLMDVGANPDKDAIFKLIMAMEADQKVGGVCGTMRIENVKEKQKPDVELDIVSDILINKVFSVQNCQSCEYDIAHLLDKQSESALDFIHVLPGAFSAYRYKAFFKNHNANQTKPNIPTGEARYEILDPNKDEILKFYLRQVLDQNYEHQTIEEANMFLAEDRVLCQLLFCNGYYLRYIPDAIVYVDACMTLKMLQLQRRRWINGSWYALNYVSDTYQPLLNNSGHNCWDRWMFIFSITQAKVQQFMIYIMEAFQIVWLYMILYALVQTGDEGLDNFIISTIIAFYVFLIFTIIYLSINYDPALIGKLRDDGRGLVRKRETDYYFRKFQQISTILGFISLGTVGYTLYLLITEIFINYGLSDFIDKPHVPQSYYILMIVISIGMTALPVIFSVFLLPQNIFNVILTMWSYFYYQPTYAHLFVIYSFCRIDDLSWGTKGLTIDSGTTINSDKAYRKFIFLFRWILANVLITIILLILFQINVFLLPQGIILIISVILTVFTILKGILALWYRVKYSCFIKKRIDSYINTGNQAVDIHKSLAKKFSDELQTFYKPKE